MKTAIFYTSKHGTAEKAALELKKRIDGEVALIDLLREKGQVDSYDNIIIGTGIYAGKIPEEMKSFLKENHDKIMEKNHGIYICSREEGEESKKYLAGNFHFGLLESSFCTAHLGHGIKLEKLGFFTRTMFKIVLKIKEDYMTINYKEMDIFAKKLKDASKEENS